MKAVKNKVELQVVAQEVPNLRVSRISNEFTNGFKFLKKHEKTVTFFGSARAEPDTLYYQEAFNLAYGLSRRGYTIITGGGGGVMEAANKGAFMAGGKSVGLNINLIKGERKNKYVGDSIAFHYFFTRKVMLTFSAKAFIFMPGGFGTLDEFFEILTLVQTQKIKKIPIILVHKDYWEPLLAWFDETLYKRKKVIDRGDTSIYHLVNSVDEALDLLEKLI